MFHTWFYLLPKFLNISTNNTPNERQQKSIVRVGIWYLNHLTWQKIYNVQSTWRRKKNPHLTSDCMLRADSRISLFSTLAIQNLIGELYKWNRKRLKNEDMGTMLSLSYSCRCSSLQLANKRIRLLQVKVVGAYLLPSDISKKSRLPIIILRNNFTQEFWDWDFELLLTLKFLVFN